MYQLISKGEVHTMNYAYTYTYTPLFSMILPILALLLILAGGIALYTLFVRKPNHYHGAAAKLHDFLNFRHAYTEGLLKILYCMTVAALAVYSVILLFFHFFWAILLFIVGNIAARLGYEFIMMLFSMHRTLRSIDRKMPEPQPFEQPAPAPQPEPQNTPWSSVFNVTVLFFSATAEGISSSVSWSYISAKRPTLPAVTVKVAFSTSMFPL